MQTPRESLIESVFDVGLGFLLSLLVTWSLLPHIPTDGSGAIVITVACTFTSFSRRYIVRRVFNYFLLRRIKNGS